MSYYCYYSVYSIIPYTCMSITFIAIVCGNSFLGLLTSNAARLIGQISYSIYLLHGFLLYTIFNLLLKRKLTAGITEINFWMITMVITILLIFTCSLTYKYIEEPFINSTGAISEKLKSYFKKNNSMACNIGILPFILINPTNTWLYPL